MQFYYGYISGSYLHNKNHIALLSDTSKQEIILNTFIKEEKDSKFGRFGLSNGWSSIIADDVDWDLTLVADPIRTMLELLYEKKFTLADYMIKHMFTATAGLQELAIACCDMLLRYDDNAEIFDFLCKRIPLFRTTVTQRTAYIMKRKGLIPTAENKKKRRKKYV